jgi:hypothetical protein
MEEEMIQLIETSADKPAVQLTKAGPSVPAQEITAGLKFAGTQR